MKKLLLILFVLIGCEKTEQCWHCDIIETMELSNKSYVRDTTITETTGSFIYCGDGLDKKRAGYEVTEQVDEYYINGTVFYWSGEKYITTKCKRR